ncbi:MAG: PadR family transcriptional regulator [Promethearchaeota archaeon]
MLLFPEKDSKISSLVEYLILLTLKKEGRLRGVDIINKLSAKFQRWKPKSGTIYPVLNRLFDKKELISLEGKYYQINQAGEKILEEYLNLFIYTIIFIDNIFNYSRSLMNELDIMKFEQIWLQNHMRHVISLIDALPMVRSNLSDKQSPEIFINLKEIQNILQTTLQAIERQIVAIKDKDKIIRIKIK